MTRRTSKVSKLSDRRSPCGAQRDPEDVIRWWTDEARAGMLSPKNPVAWMARWARSARKVAGR